MALLRVVNAPYRDKFGKRLLPGTVFEGPERLARAFPDRIAIVERTTQNEFHPQPVPAQTPTTIEQKNVNVKRGLIVGCYTPGDYAQEAEDKLISSVRRLGLPYDIREIPNRGTWILNNSACQLFLQKMIAEFPTVDFIYCDVDGIFRADPWPELLKLDCDIAAHFLDDKELLSGTLYLPAVPRRKDLIDKWVRRNTEFPNVWDQRNLQHLLEEDKTYKVSRLPAEYCYIFDTHKRRFPNLKPIVEHYQASRRFKERVKPLNKAPVSIVKESIKQKPADDCMPIIDRTSPKCNFEIPSQADLDDPLVSILMPTNDSAAPWLEKAIASALNQVYKNIQLCISVDGPSPKALNIIKQQKDSRIVWQKWPKGGYSIAINAAASLAKGSIIARLDSDDMDDPTRIERMVRFLQNMPFDCVSCDYGWMDEEDNIIRRFPCRVPDLKSYMEKNATWCIGSIVSWARVWELNGAFNASPELVLAADSEWAMRIMSKGLKIGHIPSCMYYQRRRPGQMSAEPSHKQQEAFRLAANIYQGVCV